MNVPINATLMGNKLYGSSGRVAFINQTSSSYVNHASTSVDTYQNGTVPYTPTSAAGYEIKGSNPFVASASIVSHVGEMPFKSHTTVTQGSNVVTLYTNGGQTSTNLQGAPGDITVKVPVPDTILYPSGMYVNSGRVSAADGVAGFSNGRLYSNGVACTYPRSFSMSAYVTQTITDGTVTTTTKFYSTFFTTSILTVGGTFRGSGKEKYVSLYQTPTHTYFATYPSAPYYFNGHEAYFKSGTFYTTPISIIQGFTSTSLVTSINTGITSSINVGYWFPHWTSYNVKSMYYVNTDYGVRVIQSLATYGREYYETRLIDEFATWNGLSWITKAVNTRTVTRFDGDSKNHATDWYSESISITPFIESYNGATYTLTSIHNSVHLFETLHSFRGEICSYMDPNHAWTGWLHHAYTGWPYSGSNIVKNTSSFINMGTIEHSISAYTFIHYYTTTHGLFRRPINMGTSFLSLSAYLCSTIGDITTFFYATRFVTSSYKYDTPFTTAFFTYISSTLRSSHIELPSMFEGMTNYALDGTQHYKGVEIRLWSNHTDLRTYTSRLVCVSPATVTDTLVTGAVTNFSNGVYGCACRMVTPTVGGIDMINITLTSAMSFTGDGVYSNAGRKFSVKGTLVYPVDITGTYLAHGSYVTITLPAVNTHNTEWINSKVQGFDEMNDCYGDRLMEIETDY